MLLCQSEEQRLDSLNLRQPFLAGLCAAPSKAQLKVGHPKERYNCSCGMKSKDYRWIFGCAHLDDESVEVKLSSHLRLALWVVVVCDLEVGGVEVLHTIIHLQLVRTSQQMTHLSCLATTPQ